MPRTRVRRGVPELGRNFERPPPVGGKADKRCDANERILPSIRLRPTELDTMPELQWKSENFAGSYLLRSHVTGSVHFVSRQLARSVTHLGIFIGDRRAKQYTKKRTILLNTDELKSPA